MHVAEQPKNNRAGNFATTRWTVVLNAGHRSSPECQAALAALCQEYWYPLYVFVRRRGYERHEAQDLTQEFFSRLLEKGDLQTADPQRGRFRSFLLAALQNFLANQWDRQSARKRGGGQTILSLDLQAAEDRLTNEPAHQETPETLYHRRWALLMLERALQRVRDEYQQGGREALFTVLEPHLVGQAAEGTNYRQIAERLEISESSVKVAVHRLRKRFRDAMRQEIAQTVTHPEEIDDEIRQLFAALG
jgi:RNA polymerase sigma factor (sigma-70 family)